MLRDDGHEANGDAILDFLPVCRVELQLRNELGGVGGIDMKYRHALLGRGLDGFDGGDRIESVNLFEHRILAEGTDEAIDLEGDFRTPIKWNELATARCTRSALFGDEIHGCPGFPGFRVNSEICG